MIHDLVIDHLIEDLTFALVTSIPADDPTRAGYVGKGPLQGDPDPDAARISVTVHENDPDILYKPGTAQNSTEWTDEVYEVECGGALTWKRRFTVKGRCLLASTGEGLDDARSIASTLRRRIETTILKTSWANIIDEETGEYVSRNAFSDAIKGEMVQAGGPPDAYDYHIKIRFELLTTVGVNP